MNFINNFSRTVLAALDFGEDTVTALIGEHKTGKYHSLGLGVAPARGISGGRVEHIGDAVESVVAAVRQAEERAGVSAGTWYFNFFDPEIECTLSRGSKTLKGEGQIRAADLMEVRQIAERLVGHFEKNIVYSREAGYTIDERDFVSNPLGIFGRKLEVDMRILLARSAHLDAWQRILTRARIKKAVPVASAWATAYGILPEEDRERPRLILDAGKRRLNIFIFGNNMITRHRSCALERAKSEADREASLLREASDFSAAHGPLPGQVLVTGGQVFSTAMLEALRERLGSPVSEALGRGISGLEDRPALIGLLMVADELENKRPLLHKEKGLLVSLKGKASSFLSDYF